MKILVVNDDGVSSNGIQLLASLAREVGEVTVVAPASQCSAMSRRITVHGDLTCEDYTEKFGVEGVTAYAIGGTPADCVKLGIYFLCPDTELVMSGINNGYNVGVDLYYSGTMGAALEGLERGVKAIAYSCEYNGEYGAVKEHLLPVTKELLKKSWPEGAVWNVNFPGCTAEECKGVLYDRVPDKSCFFMDSYEERTQNGVRIFEAGMYPAPEGMEGSDMNAVLNRYVSVGLYHPTY